jgi:hypothetical protein
VLVLFAACGGSTLPVAENSATGPEGGATHPDGAAVGVECCPIDDAPSCCMSFGGTARGPSSCAETCDFIPGPGDPDWVRRTNADGCATWEHPYIGKSPDPLHDPRLCGSDSKLDGGGTSGCVPACSNGQVCVSDQIVGGAFVSPDDAGACPPNQHRVNNQCVNDPTYHCLATPPECAGAPVFDCSCASSLCTSQSTCGFQCKSASETQVDCLCALP